MHFHVEGIQGYSGDYPFSLERPFTNGELHRIKEIAGVRSFEIEDAFRAGDNDLMMALAVIAIERSGAPVLLQAFWAADVGAITLQTDPADAEDDAGPPDPTPPAENGNGGEKQTSSGNSSEQPTANQANDQSRTGAPR